MGIFNRTNKNSKETIGATIIANGTYMIGGINTYGTVHIDGKFEGVILDADIIYIGKLGEVIGDIKANNLVVSGLFDGKVDCNEVHICSTGKIIGEIKYNELYIDTNGKFEGKGIKKNSTLSSNYHRIENKIDNIIKNPSILSK